MSGKASAAAGRDIRTSAMVATGIAFLVFLYLFSPFTQVFLGWFVDFEDNRSHVVHEVTFGALFAILFVGVYVQLRSSTRNFAGLVQAAAAAVTLAVVIAASTGPEPYALLYVIPLGVLIWLHPDRRDFTRYRIQAHHPMLWLMALVAVPLLDAFGSEFRKAVDEAAGHQSHWAGMAAFALTLLITGVAAALRVHGWPILAVTTGIGVLVYSVLSLLNPFDASARPGVTGTIGVVWSLGFLYAARAASPTPASLRAEPRPARPKRAPKVLRTVGPVLLFMFLGATGLSMARSLTPPPAPHAIESIARSYCVTCHATGERGATRIDPIEHPFGFDGSLQQCYSCHNTQEAGPVAALGPTGPLRPSIDTRWPSAPRSLRSSELPGLRTVLSEATAAR